MGPKVGILWSQNVVRKTACFLTQNSHQIICFVCPVNPGNRVKTYTRHQQTHVSLFLTQSFPDTNNCQSPCQKRTHKSTNMSHNPLSKLAVFSAPDSDAILEPKLFPNRTQNYPRAPLGAQGAAWGSHGTQKMSLCQFGIHFGTQIEPQIANVAPKKTTNCCPK